MQDSDDLRRAPESWRDYARDSIAMFHVIRWAYAELTTPQSRAWTRRFLYALVATTVFQLTGPWVMQYVVSGAISKNKMLVVYAIAGYGTCLFLRKVANGRMSRAREWVHSLNFGSVDHAITQLFFEKSMGQHMREGSSLHVSNIDKGRWRVIELMDMLAFEGMPILFMMFISYVFLWFLSPVCGTIMTAVVAAHVGWSLHLNQQVAKHCTPFDKSFRKLNRRRVERWEKMERVKTSGKEAEELLDMDERWKEIEVPERAFWLWFVDRCVYRGTTNTLGVIAVISYGAWLVLTDVWSAGNLYPLYVWTAFLSDNLWQISRVEHQLNWNLPSVRSMKEALTIEPDITDASNAAILSPDNPVHVEVRNLTYGYPPKLNTDGTEPPKVPVLKNLSLSIPPGKKVAIIGSSGAGKTTLMRLLLRFMDPDSGEILVNGHRLPEVNLRSWMRLIGYIPQQPQVLDGTIRYNLTYRLSTEEREHITDDELLRVMKLLKIDFEGRLVDGLDTLVGRNGMELSGGQCQRLMIGAAIIGSPRFMVIDEATSSLDATTERLVHEGLEQILSNDVSALVITHRLSTVRYLCDEFIVLRDASTAVNGTPQIEARGTSFEELFERSETFRRLAQDQSIDIDEDPIVRFLGHRQTVLRREKRAERLQKASQSH